MIIKYSPLESLPQLAWCARIDKGAGYVSIFHGKGVETNPSGFIEGAWNGQFASFDVINATIICGTGAVSTGENIRFFSSTDRFSPLYSIVLSDSIFVSNSPLFALTMAGMEPHNTYPFYTYDLLKIWREGLYCLSGKLKTNSVESLRIHFSAIMTVNTRSVISFETHSLCAAPEDYTSYQAKLIDGVKQIFENAGDSHRQHPYKPLAAISNGYDSTATAVLASQAGCSEAVTFFDSRHSEPYSDSGRKNASRLGMDCMEYDRWAYLKRTDLAEAEFGLYATAVSTPMLAMETQLAGRVLVSGHFGDTIWGKKKSSACDNLCQPWLKHNSGLSQIEFRLRVGYLAFTPTFIGARHNQKIHSIAISDEMRSWSIPGDYDRPIPRRIAEESGLSRNSFGMQQKAGAHSHYITEKNFSEKSWAHYQNFVKQRVQGKQKLPCFLWRVLAWNRNFAWKILNIKRSRFVVKSSRLQRTFPFLLNRCPILVPWPFILTFQWSFSLLKDRYKLPENE